MSKHNGNSKRKSTKGKLKNINGEVLDVHGIAGLVGCDDRAIRARVARNEIPYRRWGGRIIFFKDEVLQFLRALPGPTVEEIISKE